LNDDDDDMCTYNGRRERMRKKESIGTEFYYIGMTAKKRRKENPCLPIIFQYE